MAGGDKAVIGIVTSSTADDIDSYIYYA